MPARLAAGDRAARAHAIRRSVEMKAGIVARDETRLDVLASDADPRVSEAFSDRDYHDVATLDPVVLRRQVVLIPQDVRRAAARHKAAEEDRQQPDQHRRSDGRR